MMGSCDARITRLVEGVEIEGNGRGPLGALQ